jgi:hypothetical protein
LIFSDVTKYVSGDNGSGNCLLKQKDKETEKIVRL